MPAPAAPRDWRFESRLPWPGVRGRRLWQHVTTGGSGSEDAHGSDAHDDDDDDDDAKSPDDDDDDLGAGLRRRRASLAVPSAVRYEVEMCASTAGHIALVLLRRDASLPSPPAHAHGDDTTAAAAAQLAIPRVLYVVDAVPPKRASAAPAPALKRHASLEPRWTMLSSAARAHSFGGATSAASAEGVATPSLVFSSVPPQQQHVDELALIEELFTTSRATKDACILAKPPLLCARFDCRLVAVQFSRAERSPSALSTTASPLRCVVAREDGMCYIWEWSADLHTWSFLNRFCFLDNPNLKWTRPVVLFSTAHCPAWNSGSPGDAVETTELAWWSAETKDEPKLFVRKIQFGVEKNTFRTEIRIGSAFQVPRARDVAALHSSPLGLWVVSRSDGVRLRSVATLRVLQLSWATLWGDNEANDSTPLTCVHGVTGELLALHGGSGRVAVVGVRTQQDGELSLTHKPLLTIASGAAVTGIAAHRQLLLVLRQRVDVYSVVSGAPLVSLVLPAADPLALWTAASSGSRLGASAVGLVGARGYWQLRTPSGHALTALHSASGPHALRVARPYGETLAFDAARVALELLQSARALVSGATRQAAWDAAVQRLSSPALLLAALQSESARRQQQQEQLALLDDMAELVASIYRVTHEVLVTGRFGAAVDKRDDARLLRGLPYVTPANVDALHHLANWVLLAKRKLARLQGAVVHKGPRHARARTVSSLSTFTEDDDGTVDDDDVLEDPAATLPALHVDVHHARAGKDDAADEEASSSRLSRQLRPMTSLQFAAGSCSTRHGAQWLAQLEALLLPPSAPPHALLFHGERELEDFQVALSSFSKHLYFESMARLYLLHAPHKLLAFVRTVAQFAPRLFTLRAGAQPVVRSHAERALALLPPAQQLVDRVRRDAANDKPLVSLATSKHARRKRSSSTSSTGLAAENDGADPCDAKTTLLVYAELLELCGRTLEACRVLLDADLYDDCVDALLLRTKSWATASDDSDTDRTCDQTKDESNAVRTAVFFALLDHCVAHRGAQELETLLAHKPHHVDALLVLRALRQLLPRQMVRASSGVVSVGALRKVLLRLVREHSTGQRAGHQET